MVKSIEKIISDYLTKVLFLGNLPWRCHSAFPSNAMNGMKYGGINALLLSNYSNWDRFTSRWWSTKPSWIELDAEIPPKASYFPIFSSGGFEYVYNGNQTKEVVLYEIEPDYLGADNLIEKMESRCHIEYTKISRCLELRKCLYYYPPINKIEMPPRFWWLLTNSGVDAFYQSIFHEFMHYTEFFYNWHKKPELDRELRAEIGTGFLMSEFAIKPVGYRVDEAGGENAKHFRQNWIAKMQKNPLYIHKIVNSAIEGVDFLLNIIDKFQVRNS